MALNPRIADWSGRCAWIVGASSGIGRATASALHARGARVAVSARGTDALKEALRDIQAPVRDQLDRVVEEMWRIVARDGELMPEVTHHLLGMKGKMFRPTLLLLSSEVEGQGTAAAVTMGAVVELIHLATLVHDDAVDHSVLRRGMPTINALFSHQVSVIFGDFLYSRALLELVERGDLDPLRVFTRASNQLTLGEIRQLAAVDALTFTEQDYEKLTRHKTAVLFRAACEVGSPLTSAGRRRWCSSSHHCRCLTPSATPRRRRSETHCGGRPRP